MYMPVSCLLAELHSMPHVFMKMYVYVYLLSPSSLVSSFSILTNLPPSIHSTFQGQKKLGGGGILTPAILGQAGGLEWGLPLLTPWDTMPLPCRVGRGLSSPSSIL